MWKEEFRKQFVNLREEYGIDFAEQEAFIESEIIEKLIDELPEQINLYQDAELEAAATVILRNFKQNLKAKWLDK